LETETLGYLRNCFRNELRDVAPPEWTPETLDELVEAKIEESQRIIDALSTPELGNEFAMERHAEKAVAEVRSLCGRIRIGRRIMAGIWHT